MDYLKLHATLILDFLRLEYCILGATPNLGDSLPNSAISRVCQELPTTDIDMSPLGCGRSALLLRGTVSVRLLTLQPSTTDSASTGYTVRDSSRIRIRGDARAIWCVGKMTAESTVAGVYTHHLEPLSCRYRIVFGVRRPPPLHRTSRKLRGI